MSQNEKQFSLTGANVKAIELETIAQTQPANTTPNALDALQETVSRFIASHDVCEGTKSNYRVSLKQYFAWQAERGLDRPTRDDILAYKNQLEEEGKSNLTISSYLTSVRQFFAWAESMLIFPNIAQDIKGLKVNPGFGRDSLSKDEAMNLLDSMDKTTLEGKRDYAVICLLMLGALRTIEVIRADIRDIQWQTDGAGVKQPVLVVQGKGRDSKDEFIVLGKTCSDALDDYLNFRNGDFTEASPLVAKMSTGSRLATRTIRAIAKKHLRDIGLDSLRISAHSLRLTACTLALESGASIKQVQEFARHASMKTTLVYAHSMNCSINRIQNSAENMLNDFLK